MKPGWLGLCRMRSPDKALSFAIFTTIRFPEDHGLNRVRQRCCCRCSPVGKTSLTDSWLPERVQGAYSMTIIRDFFTYWQETLRAPSATPSQTSRPAGERRLSRKSTAQKQSSFQMSATNFARLSL